VKQEAIPAIQGKHQLAIARFRVMCGTIRAIGTRFYKPLIKGLRPFNTGTKADM
jgi:hypothetical protein